LTLGYAFQGAETVQVYGNTVEKNSSVFSVTRMR